jgi:sortase A
MIRIPTWAWGGRAALRALSLAICAAGFVIVAQGVEVPLKAALAQVLLDRAFAQSLAEGRGVKPWPWADTVPVARISVARLRVSDVVLSGGSGQAMAFGPTALPQVGASGMVTVLAAHRDTHFTFVRDLRIGDEIVAEHVGGGKERYRVVAFQTVPWDRFSVPSDPPRPMLALATCYPFGATAPGPLRRVAWAEHVGPNSASH